MAETAIEWATHVWNPVTGCDRVSPGCAHCYALTYAGRLKAMGQPKYQRDGGKASGPGFGVTLHPDELLAPQRWRKPRRVFVNSMSDLFHEEVPDGFIARVWNAMGAAPRHQFLVLTKRAERMQTLISDPQWWASASWDPDRPLPNVWLGVSIENRRYVHRADLLRQTPAAVRFISAEPLLGPLIAPWRVPVRGCLEHGIWPDGATTLTIPELDLAGIDWLIVGGESGPEHRPIREEWVRDLHDAVQHAGTAFFFKQWGGRTPKAGGRLLDGRTWDELPARTARDA
jgi:protein gp37